MGHTPVSAETVRSLPDLDDWECTGTSLVGEFRARDFVAGAVLVGAIADAAEAVDHHPDLTLRFPGIVGVVLTTHDTGGLTTADVDLARQITALARAVAPDRRVGE